MEITDKDEVSSRVDLVTLNVLKPEARRVYKEIAAIVDGYRQSHGLHRS